MTERHICVWQQQQSQKDAALHNGENPSGTNLLWYPMLYAAALSLSSNLILIRMPWNMIQSCQMQYLIKCPN